MILRMRWKHFSPNQPIPLVNGVMMIWFLLVAIYLAGCVAGARLYFTRHSWAVRVDYHKKPTGLWLSRRERQATSLFMGSIWPLVLIHHAIFARAETLYDRNKRLEAEAAEREKRILALERELGVLPRSESSVDLARWRMQNRANS